LHRFEERYGLTSREFYEAYKRDDEAIAAVPGFDRRVWESLWVELEEDGRPVALPTDTGELLPAC
jgi:hypothetical protein